MFESVFILSGKIDALSVTKLCEAVTKGIAIYKSIKWDSMNLFI